MYGARPLKRYMQKHVETLAARLILSDNGPESGDVIVIDVTDSGDGENAELTARLGDKNA